MQGQLGWPKYQSLFCEKDQLNGIVACSYSVNQGLTLEPRGPNCRPYMHISNADLSTITRETAINKTINWI